MPFILLVMIVASLMVSCVYGPKAERKSPLNYLNGEHYATAPQGPSTLVVPITQRKAKITHLRGRLITKNGFVEVPVKNASLVLLDQRGDRVLATRSDLNGDFLFAGTIQNGRYIIEASVGAQSVRREIEVTTYEISPIVIEVDDASK